MSHARYDCGPGCPVEAALEMIGGKWKGSILWLLAEAPARFNVLRRLLGDPPARSLSDQLQALEEDGLILRTVGSGRPPAVTYALSAKGERLRPLLDALADLGVAHLMERGVALPDDRATRARIRALGDASVADRVCGDEVKDHAQ
ncbi:MAG: helix-turn-helix domain-containing protein [Pseudomonadota bacterium]